MKTKVQLIEKQNISFETAWSAQTALLESMKTVKLANRNLDLADQTKQKHFFMFCEHPHVYTLGKSGSEDHLLLDENQRKENGIGA